jgi:hypothetical protein
MGLENPSAIFFIAVRHPPPSGVNQGKRMNEDHIIAAILAAGMIARTGKDDVTAADAVAFYAECLSELLDANRPKRDLDKAANG